MPFEMGRPGSDGNAAEEILSRAQELGSRLAELKSEIRRIIFGQREVVDLALTGILSGGHVLLVGVPGLGKTRLVDTLGRTLGLATNRVQFTPDLMPADILGSEVLDEATESGRRAFRFLPGPVFCQLLMADEINRASPRTQSALLQAMQEGHVAVAGKDRPLPRPFHVLATQNPIEQEGTYPLPEAQLDRFLLQIDLSYPGREDERAMLLATTGQETAEARAVLDAATLADAQRLVRAMPIGNAVVDGIVNLVREGRPDGSALALVRDHVAWGPGPRAAQALMLATRARALLDGRLSPSLEDVANLAPAVLRHRMALSFGARAEGVTLDSVIAAMVARIGA